MQIARLEVLQLFGLYDHSIEFPRTLEDNPRSDATQTQPSILILYGPNGVGKTTLLRMLHGLLRLDFNTFRTVPFTSCKLSFSKGPEICVQPEKVEGADVKALRVAYGSCSVLLSPARPGALRETDNANVEAFRKAFFSATESLSFVFIDTRRLLNQYDSERAQALGVDDAAAYELAVRRQVLRTNPKSLPQREPESLSDRIVRFIAGAQANYRDFFASTQPDFFERLLVRLSEASGTRYDANDLTTRLTTIQEQDARAKAMGLEPDITNYPQLLTLIKQNVQRPGPGYDHFLTTLGSYVDILELRSTERTLLANRLATFERLVNSFLYRKRASIDPKRGLKIADDTNRILTEEQLSSGEYHLLYLMVSALVVRRRGTIMAIDEPEMSMHIAWQQRLISALCQCAAGAEPQFIFATHSPDVAGEFQDRMVDLEASKTEVASQ